MFKKVLAAFLCLLTTASVLTAVAHAANVQSSPIAIVAQSGVAAQNGDGDPYLPTIRTSTTRSSVTQPTTGGQSLFGQWWSKTWPTITLLWNNLFPLFNQILSKIVGIFMRGYFGV
jgi:hypothetical protein